MCVGTVQYGGNELRMLWCGWKVYSAAQAGVWETHILVFRLLFRVHGSLAVSLASLRLYGLGRTYYMGGGFVGLLLLVVVVVVWWVACCCVVYVPIYYLPAYAAARIAVNDDDLLL